MSVQTITVTWVDPVVGNGQAALKTLNVYSSLDTNGAAGPLVLFGSVNPGIQSFSAPALPTLAAGSKYFFAVQAVDVNDVVGAQSAFSAATAAIGAPGAPTTVKVTLV